MTLFNFISKRHNLGQIRRKLSKQFAKTHGFDYFELFQQNFLCCSALPLFLVDHRQHLLLFKVYYPTRWDMLKGAWHNGNDMQHEIFIIATKVCRCIHGHSRYIKIYWNLQLDDSTAKCNASKQNKHFKDRGTSLLESE